jgi:hypothetical protein
MTLHIYTQSKQPLVRYVDPVLRSMGFSTRRSTVTNPPRRLFRCHTCGRRRWAKHLAVQVYYDQRVITCADGCRRSSNRG